jgi:glycosyltransferase involved in cell wall biosynthesis
MAWQRVGPGLLTKMYNSKKFDDLFIFPSYTFLPIHLSGDEYVGHSKIYAYKEWLSTKQSYDTMNLLQLPTQFTTPDKSISILISSYNTNPIYIEECLNSIKHQNGWFNMELVWVNDGSDSSNTEILKRLLKNFERTTRFTKVVYHENQENKGIGYSLNLGVNMCSHEIIIKMDSDDIMVRDRIIKQLSFMENNPHIQVCGSQIMFFRDNIENTFNSTNHPSITWDEYIKTKSHWITNHPALCYRKSSVLSVGNYDKNKPKMIEDLEIALKLLKEFKYIHNLTESLVYYRIHDSQITKHGSVEGYEYWNKISVALIEKLIHS